MENSKKISDQVDIKSKKAQAWFDSVKLPNLNTSKVWETIALRLDQMDKRVMTWFMAMATSFTLLVAAGLEYVDHNYDVKEFLPEEEMTAMVEPVKSEIEPLQIPSQSQKIARVTSKSFNPQSTDYPIVFEPMPVAVSKSKSATNKNLQLNPRLSFSGSMFISPDQINPGLGISVNTLEWSKKGYIHRVNFEWQAQFVNVIGGESGDSNITMLHFINSNYEMSNPEQKGWTFGAGYLLNPSGEIYNDATFKFSAMRRVGRHVRFGPELITTDRFQRYIPAFSVVVNS